MSIATRSTLAMALAALPLYGSAQALEEVIVTAQKRMQSLQDTPISIAVFTDDQIEQRGISNIGDLAASIPNVKITPTPSNTASSTIAIRGSVTYNPAISWEPTVGVYIDNVYVAKNTGSAFDVADLERIEVLRGPQGTLYGKNTTGGALNLITKRPTGELGGDLEAGLGNYNLRTLRGTLNLPALELGSARLSTKLIASTKRRDGLYKNRPDPYGNPNALPPSSKELNNLDREAYRLDALLEGEQNYSLRYVFDYSSIDQKPPKAQLTQADSSMGLDDYVTSPTDNRRRVSHDSAGREDIRNRSHSLFFDYELSDGIELRYIGNYRSMLAKEQAEMDGTPLRLGMTGKDIDYNQQSQEIQLGGYSDQTEWVVGLYYFRERADAYQPADFFGSYQENPFGFDNNSKAIFGQLEWRPGAAMLDDRLALIGGLRWTEEKKKARLENDSQIPGAGFPRTNSDKRYSNVSPMVVASWEFTPDINAYAKLSQGWKAGGFNGEAPTKEAFLNPYDAETVRSYELGLKSTFFNDRLQLNAAAFHNVSKDMQQTIFLGSGGFRSNVENVGKSRINGLEVELVAAPVADLRLGLSYGYLDPKYRKFMDVDLATNERRNFAREKDFPYTPRHTVSGYAEYTFARTAWGEVIGHLDYQYVDKHVPYVNPDQNEHSRIPSYEVLNGRLTLADIPMGQGSLQLALWGKNLLNKDYRVNTIPLGPSTLSYFGDPRTWGATARYQF